MGCGVLPNFDDLVEILLQQPRSISGEFFFPFVYFFFNLHFLSFCYLLFADSLLNLKSDVVRTLLDFKFGGGGGVDLRASSIEFCG